MLPNHSPLTIAEQFGTLESLHPGRIDLGLGRAPGSDQNTMRALRRDPSSADSFPQDVLELQAYLRGQTRIPGVDAIPGKGADVPLYILGSSLFGAKLAALLGLPYGFASHFAPQALEDAVALYRREFQPSEQLAEPHVIAGVGGDRRGHHRGSAAAVRGHQTEPRGADGRPWPQLHRRGGRTAARLPRRPSGDADAALHRRRRPRRVRTYLDAFTERAQADELIVVSSRPAAPRGCVLSNCSPTSAASSPA